MLVTRNVSIAVRIRQKIAAREGFTLIELLVVVAIIGIIAVLLIPNLLDALQKAKQRTTMTDMHIVGTAWMSWLSDAASASAAGRGSATPEVDFGAVFSVISREDVEDMLVPQFALQIPEHDPWHNEYEFRLATDPVDADFPFGMRSGGADSSFDTDTYEQGKFISTDYAQDIVWAAGYFVRLPGGVATVEDPQN